MILYDTIRIDRTICLPSGLIVVQYRVIVVTYIRTVVVDN